MNVTERLAHALKNLADKHGALAEVSELLDEAEIEITKIAARNSPVAVNAMSPQERIQSFVEATKDMPHVYPHNIVNFVHGTTSVSDRTGKMKLPLQFHWKDLMDQANLAHFNSADNAKLFVLLTLIDLQPLPLVEEEKVPV